MKLLKVNLDKYERKEHFYHYLNNIDCSFSVTLDVEITNLIENKVMLYPAMLYSITKTCNKFKEFRMVYEDNNLYYYDFVNPTYTIFHKENSTFSCIYTDFEDTYEKFLKNYLQDKTIYSTKIGLFTKPTKDKNLINISMIPWIDFTHFNLNIKSNSTYLLPIFTIGKFTKKENKYYIPLSIQVHHSVIDAYHIAKFLEQLNQNILDITKSK